MKRAITICLFFVIFLMWGTTGSAIPLDLSTFTAQPGVSESGGVITFTEDPLLSSIWFYNDSFLVPNDAVSLSFDYSLTIGALNNDYLVAVINSTDYAMEIGGHNSSDTDAMTLAGYYEIDFNSYRGQTISLAFGLESNDFSPQSTAVIQNLDLAAVPEPSTIILLGIGFLGIMGIQRRKLFC
ncbi:MAG: PEP-CTERM sorting domain-containing protein [bacterium]